MEDEALALERNSSHPWVRRKAQLAAISIKLICTPSSLIEIGCGPGINLEQIRKNYPNIKLYGVDLSKNACKICKSKGIEISNSDFMKFNPSKKYDAVLMMDFLEHVENDLLALKRANSLLDKNGYLICTVPSNPSLYSSHDKNLGHYRRYSLKELLSKAKSAGFEPVFISYWNCILYPAAWILRKFRNSNESDLDSSKKFSPIIYLALSLENLLISNKIPLPFGLSIFAIFRNKA